MGKIVVRVVEKSSSSFTGRCIFGPLYPGGKLRKTCSVEENYDWMASGYDEMLYSTFSSISVG